MKTFLHTAIILSICIFSTRCFANCTASIQISSNGRGTYIFQAKHLTDTSAYVKCFWTILSDTTIVSVDSLARQDSFTFTRNGNYQVCLHVVDTACTFDTCRTISVNDAVYYPMLDSMNIWQLIAHFCFEVDYHQPFNSSRSGCYYWTQIYTRNDTVYNNHSYKQLYASLYTALPTFVSLIREDTTLRKIYYNAMDGTPDLLLYNFSMRVGDSIHLILPTCNQFGGGYGYDTANYVLDSIVSITIPAGSRRAFFLNQRINGYHTPLVWLESVGNLGEVVHESEIQGSQGCGALQCNYYPYNEIVPYRNITNVSCFSHSSGYVYFDSCAYHLALLEAAQSQGCYVVYDSCSYNWVCGGINKIASLNSFDIATNPASQQTTATLEVNQADKFTLALLDIEGRKIGGEINPGQLNEGKHQIIITLAGLRSGFYLVECRNSSSSIYRKLIVD